MPTVSAVMPPPLVEALDLAAEREGKSRSAAIVAACERWCEARGEWPPLVPVDNSDIDALLDKATAATLALDGEVQDG